MISDLPLEKNLNLAELIEAPSSVYPQSSYLTAVSMDTTTGQYVPTLMILRLARLDSEVSMWATGVFLFSAMHRRSSNLELLCMTAFRVCMHVGVVHIRKHMQAKPGHMQAKPGTR